MVPVQKRRQQMPPQISGMEPTRSRPDNQFARSSPFPASDRIGQFRLVEGEACKGLSDLRHVVDRTESTMGVKSVGTRFKAGAARWDGDKRSPR